MKKPEKVVLLGIIIFIAGMVILPIPNDPDHGDGAANNSSSDVAQTSDVIPTPVKQITPKNKKIFYCPQTFKCIAKGCAIPTGWNATWPNANAQLPHGRYLHRDKGIYKLWLVTVTGKALSSQVFCSYHNTRQNTAIQMVLTPSNITLRPAISTKQSLWIPNETGIIFCEPIKTLLNNALFNPADNLNTLRCPLKQIDLATLKMAAIQ